MTITEFTRDIIAVKNVLISCYDKTGLTYFVSELVKINPDVRIYCSSGTFNELKKVAAANIVEISEYTGVKEMPSGLVKTLHPKIHSGILADLNDEQQKKHLQSIGAVAFDLVVVNLYPFAEASKTGSIENARLNIVIGGVSLIESGAKNFPRVAVLVTPTKYKEFLDILRKNANDRIIRFQLSQAAVNYLSSYMEKINNYFKNLTPEMMKKEYKVE